MKNLKLVFWDNVKLYNEPHGLVDWMVVLVLAGQNLRWAKNMGLRSCLACLQFLSLVCLVVAALVYWSGDCYLLSSTFCLVMYNCVVMIQMMFLEKATSKQLAHSTPSICEARIKMCHGGLKVWDNSKDVCATRSSQLLSIIKRMLPGIWIKTDFRDNKGNKEHVTNVCETHHVWEIWMQLRKGTKFQAC